VKFNIFVCLASLLYPIIELSPSGAEMKKKLENRLLYPSDSSFFYANFYIRNPTVVFLVQGVVIRTVVRLLFFQYYRKTV
jgi:hypothetical protein